MSSMLLVEIYLLSEIVPQINQDIHIFKLYCKTPDCENFLFNIHTEELQLVQGDANLSKGDNHNYFLHEAKIGASLST